MNSSLSATAVVAGIGLFDGASSSGVRQGTAYPDPATIFALRGGILAANETLPMWGGCAIFENIPGASGGPNASLGPVVGRATGLTGSKALAGFSVFDQAYGMVTTPSSPVPLAFAGMQVMTYRLGSGARIAVACDPGLVDLQGSPIGSAVAWDYVNELLIPAVGATAISAGSYNSTTGLVTLTMASPVNLSPGDSVEVSGATGTGSVAAIDGTWTTAAGTSGSTVTYEIATGLTLTITGGSLTTGAAIPVDVLDVMSTNCLTVEYDQSSGFATWNYDGACAIIQI